jgi:hypothetical protein
MYRYLLLTFSAIMLLVTFNSPTSIWPFDFEFFGYRIHGNLFYWLFMVSVVAYIPLAIGGGGLFLYDLIKLFQSKRRHQVINLVVSSAVIFAALYGFNSWVFEEIF